MEYFVWMCIRIIIHRRYRWNFVVHNHVGFCKSMTREPQYFDYSSTPTDILSFRNDKYSNIHVVSRTPYLIYPLIFRAGIGQKLISVDRKASITMVIVFPTLRLRIVHDTWIWLILMLCTKLRVATLTDRSFTAADRLIYRSRVEIKSSWIAHLIIHNCAASQLSTTIVVTNCQYVNCIMDINGCLLVRTVFKLTCKRWSCVIVMSNVMSRENN